MNLILLPGMDGTGILFEPLLAELPRWMRPTVVRYPNDEPLGYPELLPIIRAACPATDDYILLAESFSGPLAILFAAAAGPNLRGLVLVATFARSPVPKLLTLLANALVFRLTPAFLQRWFLLGRDATPELSQLLDSALRQVKPRVLAARVRAVGRVNVLDELRRLSLRVLILSANDDWIIGKSRTREMYEACPAAERFEVSGPHMILEALPQFCANLLALFIFRLERGVDFGAPATSNRPWRYDRAIDIDESNFIAADIVKQKFTVTPEHYYYSMNLECQMCGQKFWFSANEQRFWYEDLRFWIDSIPKECVACRKVKRGDSSR